MATPGGTSRPNSGTGTPSGVASTAGLEKGGRRRDVGGSRLAARDPHRAGSVRWRSGAIVGSGEGHRQRAAHSPGRVPTVAVPMVPAWWSTLEKGGRRRDVGGSRGARVQPRRPDDEAPRLRRGTSLCPNSSCTVRMSAPRSSMCVADEHSSRTSAGTCAASPPSPRRSPEPPAAPPSARRWGQGGGRGAAPSAGPARGGGRGKHIPPAPLHARTGGLRGERAGEAHGGTPRLLPAYWARSFRTAYAAPANASTPRPPSIGTCVGSEGTLGGPVAAFGAGASAARSAWGFPGAAQSGNVWASTGTVNEAVRAKRKAKERMARRKEGTAGSGGIEGALIG